MTAADPRLTIAASVSAEARAVIEPLGRMLAARPQRAMPRTPDEFEAMAVSDAGLMIALTGSRVAELGCVVTSNMIAGIPVLEVHASDWSDDGTRLIYVHGGGFVGGSARANLLFASLMAVRSGRGVMSVDYTLAPRADFRTITDQIAAMYEAVLDRRPATAIGLCGDSAGGAIAASSIHKLRDRGCPLPGAAVLISPVADLHRHGDTHATIASHDFLSGTLGDPYLAYAGAEDFAHPYASPLFGDFAAGFPPTLIQAGTREILLSDSVPLYRAIRAAGGTAILDLYDGMPHVFEQMVPDAPEGRQAWDEIALFWRTHLRVD